MSGKLSKASAAVRVRSAKVAGTLRVPSLWGKGPATAQGGYGTRSVPATVRRGVTLVELLVVILIMLLITAVTVPAIAPAMKNRDVREAARMIDVFINGARARALQSGHSYGVVIERMPGQPNGSVTLSYCEQPDPYTGDYAAAVHYPGMPPGSSGSTIRLLGNGGFGEWITVSPPVVDNLAPVFPLLDTGWIAGPAPTGTGWLTNIAPGDVMVINGKSFRIWAGEPFIDIDQNGVCNITSGFTANTPIGVQEPFLDSDGSGTWTPPNPAPGQPGNVSGQPYVDPASGYFVQPNLAAGGPFPVMVFGTLSAFITCAPYDPWQAATAISSAYAATAKAVATGNPLPSNYDAIGITNPSIIGGPNTFSFSFLRRPIKTSAPSMQLPGGAVIDLGSNYVDTVYDPGIGWIVPVPGSGMEVLGANSNLSAWWSTFRANPALDPAIQGSPAQQGNMPSDPTSIMITFQPSGTVDRVYSWSEANDTNSTISVVNWTDWQGRIPAGPIYLLIGRQELLNGDPDLVTLIPQGVAPLKPIYNVQDPNALWVVINPQSGAVATAENVGYDLTSVIPQNPNPTSALGQNMPVYWAANVYYARRLARSMLDMGGR